MFHLPMDKLLKEYILFQFVYIYKIIESISETKINQKVINTFNYRTAIVI